MRTANPGHNKFLIDMLTDDGRRPLPFTIHKGDTVTAYLNHGRWVADCRGEFTPDGLPCNGAELVAPGLEMMCGSCGAEHKVTFPRNHKAIEDVLDKRRSLNQNWTTETVDELTAENIENGIWEGM